MKKLITILVLSLTLTNGFVANAEVKVDQLEISKGDFEDAYKVNFNDSKWETVTVPHDGQFTGHLIKCG
jgi:beta-galactosidase